MNIGKNANFDPNRMLLRNQAQVNDMFPENFTVDQTSNLDMEKEFPWVIAAVPAAGVGGYLLWAKAVEPLLVKRVAKLFITGSL